MRLLNLRQYMKGVPQPGNGLFPTGMFLQLNFGQSYACQLEVCTWLKHSIRKGYCCGDSENLSGMKTSINVQSRGYIGLRLF